MPEKPYRHLARTARRVESNAMAKPAGRSPATGRLPDAQALIRRSHDEHLTGAELARVYETSARTVYRVLTEAGYDRTHLWTPPLPEPSKHRRTPHRDDPQWTDLQRDYEAGDAPLVLAERYRIVQQAIDRNLKAVDGLHVRNREEAVELRSRQRTAADLVRYQLRSGALEEAAADLGVDAGLLRSTLESHGLLLHDL